MERWTDLLKRFDDFFAGNGTSEEKVAAAENSLGVSFSEEFKEYLILYGVASADGHEFTGIIDSKRLNIVDVTLSAREKHNNADNLYVVEDLQTDEILIWQSAEGKVYRTVYDGEAEYICDSLCTYMKEYSEEDGLM